MIPSLKFPFSYTGRVWTGLNIALRLGQLSFFCRYLSEFVCQVGSRNTFYKKDDYLLDNDPFLSQTAT